MKEIASFSSLTCIQQSIMNLGILMVQGLVNSFGTTVMAAFAAAVKIDALPICRCRILATPFSTFIAQNYGAGNEERMRAGLRGAVKVSVGFGLLISVLIWLFGANLMGLFIDAATANVRPSSPRACATCASRARSTAAIGCLFLFYGLYRAVGPARHVRGADGGIAWAPAWCWPMRCPPSRRSGVTGIWWSGAHRLVFGRRRGRGVLLDEEESAV